MAIFILVIISANLEIQFVLDKFVYVPHVAFFFT